MMDWTDRHCRAFHRLLAPNALLYTERRLEVGSEAPVGRLVGRPVGWEHLVLALDDQGPRRADVAMGDAPGVGVEAHQHVDQAPAPIDVEHVARTIVQMAELPLDTNVQFITIMATTMPFIGRG